MHCKTEIYHTYVSFGSSQENYKSGMVQAYVGQILLKRDILKVFTMSNLYIFQVISG